MGKDLSVNASILKREMLSPIAIKATAMKGLLTLLLLTALMPMAIGQNHVVSAREFSNMIDSVGLKFTMPDNYKEADVIENGDLFYSFAMKHKNSDFEVRYSIFPMKQKLAEYELCKTTPGCAMVHPNRFFQAIAEVNVLNMTAGKGASIDPFPKDAVKREFHADVGGSAFFEFNCAFGKGYRYGQMVALQKDGVAEVIITFMSNNKSKHSELMFEVFHSLTFK